MIDWTKPIQTRDGRPAKVLATDVRNKDYPVAAMVDHTDGTQYVDSFTADGSVHIGSSEEDCDDIINVDQRAEATRIDNNAVEVLATAMKARLAKKREEGLAGWQDPSVISDEELIRCLILRLERGEWVGAANFLLFAYHRGVPSGTVLKGLDAAYNVRHN